MSEAIAESEEIVLATASAESEPAVEGPSCEKCGAPGKMAACAVCGWYPSLGIHVEIDAAYETLNQPVAETESEAQVEDNSLAKHLAVWEGLIPGWAWMMLATTGGVLALSVASRVFAEMNPSLHATLGVTQLLVGIVLTLIIHIVAFVIRSSIDAELGLTSILLKPFKTWRPLATALPERLWLVNLANASLTAVLGAVVIVGGIPYESLLDWQIKAAPKQNLVGMIAEHAAQEGGSDSLEGAIGDFAGQAGDVRDAGNDKKPVAKPRHKLECLIIGYQLNDQERLTSLLLATDMGGKLKYAGRVSPGWSEEEEKELLASFKRAPSSRPFIKTNMTAVWLQPKFTCRVTYTEWKKGTRPKEIEWDTMLEEIRMPW